MNTELQNIVFEEINRRIKPTASVQLSEAADLATLGIDSMDIITILTRLEKKIGLDFDRMVGLTPPKTVNDLLKMVEDSRS